MASAIAASMAVSGQAAAQTANSRDYDPLGEAKARFEAKTAGARITGGTKAKLADNPWQVALVHASDTDTARAQYCGGTVIGHRWVLTAAHCVDKAAGPADIHVFAGNANLKGVGHRFTVDGIFPHEKWNRTDFHPDIALVRIVPEPGRSLGTPIGAHSDLKLGDDPPAGDIVRITGWGVTENRKFGTEDLMVVSIPFVKRKECQKTVNYGTRVHEGVFCAGGAPKDTCRGDSGGPATIEVGASRKLVGITSWGEGCPGSAGKPGVYTHVARFADWTEKKITANGGQ